MQTKAQFQKKIRAMFLSANPEATIGKTEFLSEVYDTFDAGKGRTWIFWASAPGYRTRKVIGTYAEKDGWAVR